YPEPDMFGNMPSYAVYARHVKDLSARDLFFTNEKPDARPAFHLADVHGAEFEHVVVPRAPEAPVFVLAHVSEFLLRNSPGLADTRLAAAESEMVRGPR